MYSMEDRLIKLTEFWCDYVSCDHHKDRDCHFYINKVWSYGRPPYWRIEHYGYMSELDDKEEYGTYAAALKALVDWLEEQIKIVYSSVPKNWDDKKEWDYNWKGVIDVLKKYNLYPLEAHLLKND